MESRLSDVHSIAGELMRRGELGQDNTATEGSRIVRVERQPIARAQPMMPATAPFGFDEELRKLTWQMEAIRQSVEFTEAQLAVNRGAVGNVAAGLSGGLAEAQASARSVWTVPMLLAGNLILSALLIAEIHDGRVGTTAIMLYRATLSVLTG